MKQESKTYKAVTMNLVQAKESDRYKFRNIGFMYFIYFPHKEEFEVHPKFTYRGMNVQEFNELFNMGMIYIPQGILDLIYLERKYYEKTEI